MDSSENSLQLKYLEYCKRASLKPRICSPTPQLLNYFDQYINSSAKSHPTKCLEMLRPVASGIIESGVKRPPRYSRLSAKKLSDFIEVNSTNHVDLISFIRHTPLRGKARILSKSNPKRIEKLTNGTDSSVLKETMKYCIDNGDLSTFYDDEKLDMEVRQIKGVVQSNDDNYIKARKNIRSEYNSTEPCNVARSVDYESLVPSKAVLCGNGLIACWGFSLWVLLAGYHAICVLMDMSPQEALLDHKYNMCDLIKKAKLSIKEFRDRLHQNNSLYMEENYPHEWNPTKAHIDTFISKCIKNGLDPHPPISKDEYDYVIKLNTYKEPDISKIVDLEKEMLLLSEKKNKVKIMTAASLGPDPVYPKFKIPTFKQIEKIESKNNQTHVEIDRGDYSDKFKSALKEIDDEQGVLPPLHTARGPRTTKEYMIALDIAIEYEIFKCGKHHSVVKALWRHRMDPLVQSRINKLRGYKLWRKGITVIN